MPTLSGSVMVVGRERGPVYYAKWRDSTGRQVKRMLGPAWVERNGSGWKRRRGRVPDGSLDQRAAMIELGDAIRAHEASLGEPRADRGATFADAAAAWLHHLEHVEGCKPSTLNDYRYMLAAPDKPARLRGRAPAARIIRAFGSRPLAAITSAEVGRFLAMLDAEPGVVPRTVNKSRQILCSVFEHSMREDTFRLAENPARKTDKRREPDVRPIDFYEPEEVLALARAAREGLHRDPGRPAISAPEVEERRLADEQDATLFLVAAFSGLRLGELLALRWRNVSFADAKLVVEASWSSGEPRRRNRASGVRCRRPTSPPPRSNCFHGASASRLLQHPRRVPRPVRAAPALPASAESSRTASAAVARPAPLLRQPRDLRVRPGLGQGLHGPCQDHDDGALPARPLPANRRRPPDQSVRGYGR